MAEGPVTRWSARLREGHIFDSGPEGRAHVIDADSKVAPGPVETLLAAIVTCSGVDVVDILAKRRTPVERFEVGITAYRRAEHPRRIMRLELDFQIDGAGIEVEPAERAIELAFEKYCTVAASLGADILAESRLILNGQAMEARPRRMFDSATTPKSSA
ncbi:MAG TPA: OsmC family protein [Gemmatimonadaceae bacterium]|nr:OsmC family protein [Gemmatimonadaceae bacterium]